MVEIKEIVKQREKVQGSGKNEKAVDISVIVPISERHDDLKAIFKEYAGEIASMGKSYEFIFVLDGYHPEAERDLKYLTREYKETRVIGLNRWCGEATALSVGFEQARGKILFTLASYFQVEPEEITKLLVELNKDQDLVISRRFPRKDSLFNRIQSWTFHRITRFLTGNKFHDISCGLRVMKKEVADEIYLYGDLHRFFPLLAFLRGFRVCEVKVKQSRKDLRPRIYKPGVYVRRVLDILTLFFLFKFTKKPLRFFGLIGLGISGLGGVITGYLGLYRLMGLGSISDRPLLILGVLLLVLGVQFFSLGLLGEIIIFTHARQEKEYQIKKILR